MNCPLINVEKVVTDMIIIIIEVMAGKSLQHKIEIDIVRDKMWKNT